MSRRAAKNGLLRAVGLWLAGLEFAPEDPEGEPYELQRVQYQIPVPGEPGAQYPSAAVVVSSLSTLWHTAREVEGSRSPEEGPGAALIVHGELTASLGVACFCDDDVTEDEVLGGIEEAILEGADVSGVARLVLASDYYDQPVTVRVVGVTEADLADAQQRAIRKPVVELVASIPIVRPVVAADLNPVVTLTVNEGAPVEAVKLLDVGAGTTQDAPEEGPPWPLPAEEEEP